MTTTDDTEKNNNCKQIKTKNIHSMMIIKTLKINKQTNTNWSIILIEKREEKNSHVVFRRNQYIFVNDNYYFKENYKNKTTKKNQLKFSFITQIQPNDKYEIEKQNVNQKRKHANDDWT